MPPATIQLRIRGADDNTYYDDGDGSRVFNISDGSFAADKTVSINGLTLTGADSNSVGGAIFNQENLTVNQSTITGNSAVGGGGIHNQYGTVEVQDSTISNNYSFYGAGILSRSGSAAVKNSTISGNSTTGRGGGILSFSGNVTLTDSTLSYNSASGNGGGMAVYGSYFGTANFTITGSTISGNSSQGSGAGIFALRRTGNLTVTDSLIRYNHARAAAGASPTSATTPGPAPPRSPAQQFVAIRQATPAVVLAVIAPTST